MKEQKLKVFKTLNTHIIDIRRITLRYVNTKILN